MLVVVVVMIAIAATGAGRGRVGGSDRTIRADPVAASLPDNTGRRLVPIVATVVEQVSFERCVKHVYV